MQLSVVVEARRAGVRQAWRALLGRSRQSEDTAPAPRTLAASASAAATPATPAEPSSAFEQFFRAHEPEVTGYLWRMTGDAQTAADLSQETFLRAWQRFDRVASYERPGAWLIRVATNLALQHLRRRRAPIGAAGPLEGAFHPAASDPGPHIVERDLVREVLLEQPPRERALLILREVNGYSGAEVAQMLGMSDEAARVALWRARAHFREAYERKAGRP